ncbi:hypothetical protein CVT26_010828 [Gymnopilus dilepis]|uniref:Phosphatidylethanolamine-binding protein n=1 Tax=Gymnopilus dilepis TaxID=231916 RepID=A0A409VXY3_9AGAR|nr:hypothetical protein CVT26_010828 [Gymnopilus dilepis]
MTDPLKKTGEWLEALQKNKVVGDVIPESSHFGPEVFFSIVWEDNGTEVSHPGVTLDRQSTLKQPKIKIHPLFAPDGDYTYTLVVTDPDAPSRQDPKFGEFRHWLVTGLKLPQVGASDVQGQFVTTAGNTATAWYPPEPPAGSGLHRYVFLLYREPAGGINLPKDAVEHKSDPSARKNWKAAEFGSKHNLSLVGASFFFTEIPK